MVISAEENSRVGKVHEKFLKGSGDNKIDWPTCAPQATFELKT